MKIIKIDIPKDDDNSDGLDAIKMDRLDKVVLIAGRNGAGKTRILNKVFQKLKEKPTLSIRNRYSNELENLSNQIDSNWTRIRIINERVINEKDPQQNIYLSNELSSLNQSIADSNIQITRLNALLGWNLVETSEPGESYTSVSFVPKSLDLFDSNLHNFEQLKINARSLDDVGINGLERGTFARIQVIQNRWFNATNPNFSGTEEEINNSIEEYNRLTEIIEVFLDTKIGRTIDGEATLFGFPMGKSNMSNGQKMLIQFCMEIFCQGTALRDLILILDEPENHLHPSVIIETIDRIIKCVSNGQVWIATHSIPLLAHFDPSFIWYVDNNKISYSGKTPEKVLASLLGNEKEVEKLQDFISLPSQFATTRYAIECLAAPGVVLTKSTDSQSIQIRESLKSLLSERTLRILDFGAGKGRIISNLADLDDNSSEKILDHIDYIAFDKFSGDKKLCEDALIKAYGTCMNRYFNDLDQLLGVYDPSTFDLVIMCNVFHEIEHKEWFKLFKNERSISSLLNNNGKLLLVEDHQIPIGEMAYQNGFMVLDTPHLKKLFKIAESDTDFSYNESMNGRLKAHHIPKRLLLNIDNNSKKAAMQAMSATAKDKILEIRGREKSYSNGKLHGFWTQLFANSQLILSELE